ncbi:hypothetical protein NEMBOFW57_009800 [Staphylotrichum longicolle]|uniref:EKC/KEOPS complex subunit BUD32 n=1 Tax=Staphylotrichum longicolle TaxID=669026 RepID=A0AAD4EPR4_9PEZI|nr:hypothetical protein NEMBOFW57_009800 [Staphylotrichum longicolle]
MNPFGLPEPAFSFMGHFINWYTHQVQLYDADSRRPIVVTIPNPDGPEPPDHDPEFDLAMLKAMRILGTHLNNLPPECVAISANETGELLDVYRDITLAGHYFPLAEYGLPPAVAAGTVLRSELTEIRRLSLGVDLVEYADGSRAVFKYTTLRPVALWAELQILARLPQHPHLALLDRIVLDELTASRVVGFTIKYVAGETLDKSESGGLFKLKWLKQLLRTVDDLNLKHGITHQDIARRNLIVDPATDDLVLIDFNVSCRVGTVRQGEKNPEGKWGERDDVKGVLVCVYDIITRDPSLKDTGQPPFYAYMLQQLNEKDFLEPAKWIKHPDVQLDHGVAEFYFVLMDWVRKRRAGRELAHYTEASKHLEWPPPPLQRTVHRAAEERAAGRPILEWQRPLWSKLDPKRRLLATGRYADEEPPAPAAVTNAAGKSSRDDANAGPVPIGGDNPDKTAPGKPPTKIPAVSNGAQPDSAASPAAADHGTGSAELDKGSRKLRPRQATPIKRKKQEGDAFGAATAPKTATDSAPRKRRLKRLN